MPQPGQNMVGNRSPYFPVSLKYLNMGCFIFFS